MNLSEIKHWRNCELLQNFFAIKVASTTLKETTFGEVINFLIAEVERLETAISGKTFYDVEKVTAQLCADICREVKYASLAEEKIRKEFGLN